MLLVDISTDTYIHTMKMLARVLRIHQCHVSRYKSEIYVYVGTLFKGRGIRQKKLEGPARGSSSKFHCHKQQWILATDTPQVYMVELFSPLKF